MILHQYFCACLIEPTFQLVFLYVRREDILVLVNRYPMRQKGELTYTRILDHPYEPPIAIAVVKQNHSVTLSGIGLALDSRDKCMKGIHEFEIDVL